MKLHNRGLIPGGSSCLLSITTIFFSVLLSHQLSAQGLSGTPRVLEKIVPGAGPSDEMDEDMDEMDEDMEGMDEDMEGMDEEAEMERMMMEGEMDPDDMYGGSSGPGRGARRRGVAGGGTLMYGDLASSLGGGDLLTALFEPHAEVAAAPAGPKLKREAGQAFASGNYPLALDLMFGHLAAEYPQSQVDLRTVKYSSMLRRPVWNIRFGVSMSVRGSEALGDRSPIRETTSGRRTSQPGRGGRRGGGGESSMEDEMMEAAMAEQMESEMDDQMDDQMDREMMEQMDAEMGGRGAPSGRRATPRVVDNAPQRTMLSAAAAKELDETLGLVATAVKEKFTKRFQNGDFGPVLTAVTAPAPVEPVRGQNRREPVVQTLPGGPLGPALAAALADVPEPMPMWIPGVVYLGEGASDEIMSNAKAAKLDVVLHFDVVLKPGRNDQVQNISRCRLFDVAQGKLVVVSKGMDNREAAKLAEAGRSGEREYVDEQLANLFDILDQRVKTADLPPLSAEVAKKRVASLMASSHSHSLRTLAEVQLYHALQLIDDADVEAAFHIIGGPEALMLLHGPPGERVAIARKWAILSQGGRADD